MTKDLYKKNSGESIIVHNEAVVTLSHEVGHLFGFVHTCESIDYNKPCDDAQNTYDGYNSSNILHSFAPWATKRETVGNRSSLSRDKAQFEGFSPYLPIYPHIWVSYTEYLNLLSTSIKRANNEFKKSTIVDQKNFFNFTAVIVDNKIQFTKFFKVPAQEATPNPVSGNFSLEFKDKDENIISVIYLNESELSDKVGKYVSAFVTVPSLAISYRLKSQISNTIIYESSVAYDMLKDEVGMISASYVKIRLSDFVKQFNQNLNELDMAVKCRDIGHAKTILSGKVVDYINKNMNDLSSSGSSPSVDKKRLLKIAKDALIRLGIYSVDNNSIVSFCLKSHSGQKYTIDIKPSKQFINNEKTIEAEVQLGEISQNLIRIGEGFSVDLGQLNLGFHYVKIKSFLVDKKIKEKALKQLSLIDKSLISIQQQIDLTVDNDLRNELIRKKNQILLNKNSIEIEFYKNRIKIGQDKYINFEVK